MELDSSVSVVSWEEPTAQSQGGGDINATVLLSRWWWWEGGIAVVQS